MHMARAVRGNVIAQSVEVLAAALRGAFERAFQSGEYFQELLRRLDGGIDERLGFQREAMRLLQKAKRETRDNAKGILAVNAPAGKRHGDRLEHAVLFREGGEIDRRFEERRGGRSFSRDSLDAHG